MLTKGGVVVEVFETWDGKVGVAYQLYFNQADLLEFEDPNDAWAFIASLGVDIEDYLVMDEAVNG